MHFPVPSEGSPLKVLVVLGIGCVNLPPCQKSLVTELLSVFNSVSLFLLGSIDVEQISEHYKIHTLQGNDVKVI